MTITPNHIGYFLDKLTLTWVVQNISYDCCRTATIRKKGMITK